MNTHLYWTHIYSGCVSISAIASMVGIPIGIMSSAIISHDELVLLNNILKEYNEIEEDIKLWKS